MEVMAGKSQPFKKPRAKGFQRAAGVLAPKLREVGESRGFSVSRVLTHWPEIVGEALASHTKPAEVSYGRDGFGATLTVLTTGAHAPMVEMQKEAIRERVNACYGYAAISRIRITQTAATGFSEGQAQFGAKPKAAKTVDPQTKAKAEATTAPIEDETLRAALSALGEHVLSQKRS